MTTTQEGVASNNDFAFESDGEEAFLTRILKQIGDEDADDSQPSDKGSAKTKKKVEATSADDSEDHQTDDTPDDSPGDGEDNGEAEGEAKKFADGDDTYVKIKVGDQEHEVPVTQLKRLFGQEAALTQKSQEVATKRKEVETEATKHAAGLTTMLARARERFKPYENIDFLMLSRDQTVSSEQLTALREEAISRAEDIKFLEGELGNFVTEVNQRQHIELVARAKDTVKTLTDPTSDHFIEGWDQTVYNEVRNFAISEGLDAGIVNQVVDAPAIKLLHMAMKYKAGLSKVVTTKVNKAVKKVVKTTSASSPAARAGKGGASEKAMKALKVNGTQEDAANAFLARWADKDSD